MSKQIIAVLLLLILTSACNQPINVNTLPSLTPIANTIDPTPSETPTPLIVTGTGQVQSTATLAVVPTVAFKTPTVAFGTPTFVALPTVSAACPAPVPHVKVDQQVSVTVEDWDKLKLRSQAALSSDTILMELPQYTQLRILDGPVCVLSPETNSAYLFWKVAVIPGGEIGWVAEGDIWHYFIY
jgi:hypothetical protein